jgi:hypothetical protein
VVVKVVFVRNKKRARYWSVRLLVCCWTSCGLHISAMLRLAGCYWELLQPIKAAWWVEVTSCVAPSLPVFSQPSPSVCGVDITIDRNTYVQHLRFSTVAAACC